MPPPSVPAPLLPPVLAAPSAALWLWVLPMSVLLALNAQGYWIIGGNMDAAQRAHALTLGLAGCAAVLLGGVAFAWRRHRVRLGRADAAWPWALLEIGVHVAYLWFALANADELLPRSVTAWIYPEERFISHQFTFAMVPLFHGVLELACTSPPRHTARALGVSLAVTVAVPVFLFLGAQLLFITNSSAAWIAVVAATFLVTGGVVFFVGLVRALMLGLRAARRWGAPAERVAIVMLGLVLPLAGLALNRTIPFPVDFQAWEVYALTLLNAAVLLLASWKHTTAPRLSFLLLCGALPFSLYFFLVFLPYLPLAVVAVIAMGAGFLILAPVFLFLLHLHLLNRARHAVARTAGRAWRPVGVGLLCFLVQPALFTYRAVADRTALHNALEHVHSPKIEGGPIFYRADPMKLRNALDGYRAYKDGIYYPFLSDAYNWVVFDNLVLPDDKLARLEQTFFGQANAASARDPSRGGRRSIWGGGVRDRMRMPRAAPVPRTVEVSRLELASRPTATANGVSTLTIELRNTGPALAEYRTTLPLPAGVFVNGFRLHIEGTPVPGRIFEKKTALWVYAMIRDSERRDPGLLTYNHPGELELRVFPVSPRQPSIVEIDFLTPTLVDGANVPLSTIDPARVVGQLAQDSGFHLSRTASDAFLAASSPTRELPAVDRRPYLHLIIDRSEANAFNADLADVVPRLRATFPAATEARVSLANFDVFDLTTARVSLDALANGQFGNYRRRLPAHGGCALDLALAHALCLHRDLDLDAPADVGELPPRPIFVILSRHAAARDLERDISAAWMDLLATFELHELGEDGSTLVHRAPENIPAPLLRHGSSVRPLHARAALRFESNASSHGVEHWDPASKTWRAVENVREHASTDDWSMAAALQIQNQDHARNPGGATTDLPRLVRASRERGILLPTTGYIVVENSAQWRMLELGERQKLAEHAALEFRETPAPSGVIIGAGFLCWLFLRRRGRR